MSNISNILTELLTAVGGVACDETIKRNLDLVAKSCLSTVSFGDQSTGKSSVLRRIFDQPILKSGTGTTTKIVTCIKSHPTFSREGQCYFSTYPQQRVPYRDVQQLFDRCETEGRIIKDAMLIIEIQGHHAFNIVDTPGIYRENQDSQFIKNAVQSHETLWLYTMNAYHDTNTVMSLSQVTPDMSASGKLIVVFTALDVAMDNDRLQNSIDFIQKYPHITFFLTYNRHKDRDATDEEEAEFFRRPFTEKYRRFPNVYFSIKSLRERLFKSIETWIQHKAPILKPDIMRLYHSVGAVYQQMGFKSNDPKETRYSFAAKLGVEVEQQTFGRVQHNLFDPSIIAKYIDQVCPLTPEHIKKVCSEIVAEGDGGNHMGEGWDHLVYNNIKKLLDMARENVHQYIVAYRNGYIQRLIEFYSALPMKLKANPMLLTKAQTTLDILCDNLERAVKEDMGTVAHDQYSCRSRANIKSVFDFHKICYPDVRNESYDTQLMRQLETIQSEYGDIMNFMKAHMSITQTRYLWQELCVQFHDSLYRKVEVHVNNPLKKAMTNEHLQSLDDIFFVEEDSVNHQRQVYMHIMRLCEEFGSSV